MTYRWTFMTTFKREVQIIHVPVYPKNKSEKPLVEASRSNVFVF